VQRRARLKGEPTVFSSLRQLRWWSASDGCPTNWSRLRFDHPRSTRNRDGGDSAAFLNSSFARRKARFYSVFELHTSDDLCEPFESAQPQPGFLGAHPELVEESEHRIARHTAVRLIAAMANGGKGGLDDVGAADVLLMLGRKVIAGEQRPANLDKHSIAFGYFLV
jgi:hypothetical protein